MRRRSCTAAVSATPASAATVNGVATIASPGTTTPLTSGGSTTPFSVSLPAQAACSGDTATHGYHVYSYLVHKGVALSGITFIGLPSSRSGPRRPHRHLLRAEHGDRHRPDHRRPQQLRVGADVSSPTSRRRADGLLYTGSGSSASGIWESGLACANTSGALVDNWNTEVTFAAKASDPNGFTWTAVPGPSGSAPGAFTSATSATFTEGTAGTFTPTASGNPTPVITESGTLPAGVAFSGGVLSGTPRVAAGCAVPESTRR